MSAPDKCPNCGAEDQGDCEGEGTLYLCGSYEPEGNPLVRSKLCLEHSARQKAEKERDDETWRVGQAEQELAKVRADLATAKEEIERLKSRAVRSTLSFERIP